MTVNLSITRRSDVEPTPRVQQLRGMFDIPPGVGAESKWFHHFDLPDTWSVGVIVGPSGSGKSTLAREWFGPDNIIDHWPWPANRSILDGFPPTMGIREITTLLCSVGFSSPPAWIRPFQALSTGEQFRVNVARALAQTPTNAIAVVDEFTSVVDRTVAQIASAAVAKAVRKRNQKFVAITCHYDVLDWLEPDWVYEPAVCRLQSVAPGAHGSGRSLWRRPPINLEIIRAHSSAWNLFKPHHYLSADIHKAAACFVALYENRPAAFVAVLPFPHATRPAWREHRCVCLPDYQGVGIGNALSEFVARFYTARGRTYRSTTSHPGMIRHRAASSLWKMVRRPSLGKPHTRKHLVGSVDRLTASFEYVGSFSSLRLENRAVEQ